MERRRFLTHAGLLGIGVPLGLSRAHGVHGAAAAPLRPSMTDGRRLRGIDGRRLNAEIAELRTFGGTPDGGTHRVAYSDEDLGAREWVLGLMRDAGLRTWTDAAGNLVGELQGSDAAIPPLGIGSHIDTVPYGGSYDGTIGVLGAIEIVRSLQADGTRLRHPLRVYVFQNEEGGKTGSRLLIRAVDPTELDVETASGFSIRDGIRRVGGNPDDLAAPVMEPGSLAAFLELHIEQGATLERAGVPIGVVEGIVGIRRWFVTVTGEKNHAGTTPMDQRRDALVTASRLVTAIHETALGMEGRQVATVGRIEVSPGAANVIPESARFTLEVRDLSMDGIQRVFDAVREAGESMAERDGTRVEMEPYYLSEAAPADEGLRRAVEGAADDLGLAHLRLPSGAGHDAQSMAKLCPMGMVFVPSRGGISHAPEEFTAPEQITAGVEVLMWALMRADGSG